MAKMTNIEEIDNNLKGLTSLLFALAAQAEECAGINGDCLLLLANVALNTQKLSEEELKEAASTAKKKRDSEVA